MTGGAWGGLPQSDLPYDWRKYREDSIHPKVDFDWSGIHPVLSVEVKTVCGGLIVPFKYHIWVERPYSINLEELELNMMYFFP